MFALAHPELGFGGLDRAPGGLDFESGPLHLFDLHGTVGNSEGEQASEERLGESDEENFYGY